MKFNQMTITIPGEPQGKARPRVTIHGAYTPTKTKAYENLVKTVYQAKYKEQFQNDVHVIINAYFKIPKSTSKSKKELMLQRLIRPTKKPDCDNIAKAILDALNNVAYHDDSQVISLTVNKYYSNEPRVEVFLNEFSN